MQIIGHEKQREILKQALSSGVLLQGPSGVGKWLCARSHANEQGGAIMALRDGPTVEQAREMAELYTQRPISGRLAVSLVDLDRCSSAVMNTLLKPLEEMPAWGRVILVASRQVPATILSRVQKIQFNALTIKQVSDILVAEGVSPSDAKVAAKMSYGSVERGLAVVEAVRSKPAAMQYIDAVVRHDRTALMTMLPRWDVGTSGMLWQWNNEVLADWPRVFTKEELSVVHRLGVDKFYALVKALGDGDSPDLAAQKVWKMR